MHSLRTFRDPPRTSQDRPRRPHGPCLSVLGLPSAPLARQNDGQNTNSSSPTCAMLGPGKHAIHTIGVAKMREFRALGPHEPSQDLQRPSQDLSRPSQETPRDLPKRSRRRQVTVLDHSGPLFAILRAPSALLGPQNDRLGTIPPCYSVPSWALENLQIA